MYAKYIKALELMDAVIATKSIEPPEEGWIGCYLENGTYKPRKNATLDHPCNAAWDEAYTFIHANFVIPESMSDGSDRYNSVHAEVALCKPLIDGTYPPGSAEMIAAIRAIPPVIAEVVFPVAIARFLLRDHQIPVSHLKLKTFREFHKRYATMILSS